jgi:hypothetical protein
LDDVELTPPNSTVVGDVIVWFEAFLQPAIEAITPIKNAIPTIIPIQCFIAC